jgi:uracil-DNA glycosylase family protein
MTAADFVPAVHSLDLLREAACSCHGCSLWENATQTVFGDGPNHASLMLVGEQPGDVEDREGEPFVGPAGGVLDRALAEAGIDRDATYVTNAVKHFKWRPAGKRRLHQKPSTTEVVACRPWLVAEVDAVQPDVIVALGATAARSAIGRPVKVTKERGEVLQSPEGWTVVPTVHPSSILRADDAESREAQFGAFVADLSAVPALLARR